MENKLQELTRTLYAEGLEKGRSEAEALVAEAKAEAAKILAEAKAEADSIVKQAEKRAEDVEKNSLTEIALAGKQAVAKIKSEIATMIIAKTTGESVKAATLDAAFLKEMLVAVAKNWDGAGAGKVELKALLPEAERKALDASFEKAAKELLAAGVEVGYSAQVRTGFKVGQKEGGYYISFTDEDFDALMKEYLREKVAHLLYEAK
jgi:V/A-type H+-transporting ATPase subunit E